MKKAILAGTMFILLFSLFASCGDQMSQTASDNINSDLTAEQTQAQSLQSDLDKAQNDLLEAQARILSLQSEKEALEKSRAEALFYIEFVDIMMNKMWKDLGITPRFTFASVDDILNELRKRAADSSDTRMNNYGINLSEDISQSIMDYCFERIETVLK